MSSMQVPKSEQKPSFACRVAFQGEIGAYSQSAVYAFFGRSNVKEVTPLPTLRKVFASLSMDSMTEQEEKKRVDYAVVPIENSLAGSIGETIDLLVSSAVRIVGEVSLPIFHVLISQEDSSIDQIRKVISHPQAIAQCKNHLDSRNWEEIPVYDTAGAAKMIKEGNLKDTAAIASELAAEIYGLKVLESHIEDDNSNQTRFIVIESRSKKHSIQNKELETNDNYKTSLLFSTRHEPGSLVEALSAFSTRGINLTKIESRPMKSRPWEYYFFVDFEGHEKDERCKEALDELKRKTVNVKLLGSYERHT